MNKEKPYNLPMGSKEKLIVMCLFATTLSFMFDPLSSQASMPPMTDQSIEKAVEAALLIDEGVPAHLIDVELNLGYGYLKAGNLTGNTDINLEFGSGTSQVESISHGELNIKYSKIDVGEAGNMDINAQFE